MNKQKFYSTSNLTIKAKKELLKYCHSVCTSWWTDILDCKKSCARESVKMGFTTILSMLRKSSHFVIIERRGWPIDGHGYGEIGFSTSSKDSVSHFLFIMISIEDLNELVKKYDLKE